MKRKLSRLIILSLVFAMVFAMNTSDFGFAGPDDGLDPDVITPLQPWRHT